MSDGEESNLLVQVKIEEGELDGGGEDECFGWGEDWEVKSEVVGLSSGDESVAGSKRRMSRKPVREMSEGEREVMQGKWREGGRVKRGKMGEKKKKKGVGRKPVREMSEEEREAVKVKWREEARAKRAKMRERMSEGEREAFLAVQRERRRAQREAMRAGGISEVELEERRRVEREKKRVKRAGMSFEERRVVVRKVLERRKQRMEGMGEEERKSLRVSNYFRYVAWVGRRSDEDKEAERRRRAAAARVKLQGLTEEERAERNRVARERRANASEEKKEEGRRKLREAYYRRRGGVVDSSGVRLRRRRGGKKGDDKGCDKPKETAQSTRKQRSKRVDEELTAHPPPPPLAVRTSPLIAPPKLILPPNYGLNRVVVEEESSSSQFSCAVGEEESCDDDDGDECFGSEFSLDDDHERIGGGCYGSSNNSGSSPGSLDLVAQKEPLQSELTFESQKPVATEEKPQKGRQPKSKEEEEIKPRIKKPRTAAQLRRGPRGPNLKFDVVRDAVCEECGNKYNRVYLPEHKRMFHNPHYVDGVCLVCGGGFGSGAQFRKHYKAVHQVVSDDGGGKGAVCEECGVRVKSIYNLKSHQYYVHGDGLKVENHVGCEVCGMVFKTKVQLYSHSRKRHPGVNAGGGVKCFKCGVSGFKSVDELKGHVEGEHVGFYYPCEYCSAVRFSERGLRFHVRNYCKGVGEGVRGELVAGWGGEDGTVERMPLDCEVCGRSIALFSLKRHYSVVHGVREKEFSCWGCGKLFKSRQYWVLHMEGVCNVDVDFERVRCLNAELDNGVVVLNVGGVKGGVGKEMGGGGGGGGKTGTRRGTRRKKKKKKGPETVVAD